MFPIAGKSGDVDMLLEAGIALSTELPVCWWI